MRAFARLVLLSLVATAFSLHVYAQCPGTMAIVGPADGQNNVPLNASNTVTVKWVAVAGATSYDVYFGTPGQGCAASPRASVTATEFSPPANDIARGGTYEWRVKANTPGCRETACATFTVAACPSAGPTLNSPADGNQISFGTVTLDWSDVPNASLYELFVGIDGDPLSAIGTTTLTQKTLSFEPGRTIRWKVVANSPGCTGVSSTVSTFTTSCPTGAPSLRTPDNGSQVTGGTAINFSWTALAGATSYDLEGSAAGQNQWQLLGENIAATSATKVVPEGTWNWRVRANFDSSCTPAYSETRSFSVGPSCANSAPELIDPSPAEKVKSPVTFRWSDVAATEYRVFLQGAGDPAPVLLTTTTRTEHVATLDADLYTWSVIAKFASCPDRAAGGRQFEVEPDANGCPTSPGEAKLLTPAANATGLISPVTFTWEAVNKATGYRVLASFDDDPAVTLGATTGTSLTAAVPSGPGNWVVQTLFGADCPTTLSDRRAFTVSSGAVCGNTAPHSISPANGATNVDSPVTFVWGPVAGAVSYRLFVAPGDDEFSFYGETEETTLTRFVPSGSAKWFVTAQFAACAATKSAVNAFVVSDRGCANASIELRSPTEGSTPVSPVRMSWSGTGIGSSESYRVWVAVDDDAPVVIARTTALEALVSLPSGDFTWYVDVSRTNCEPVISGEGHFKVAKNTNCSANAAPLLTSPVGTEQAPAPAASPASLVWGAVPNAIGYRVWLSEKGEAFEDVALTRDTHQSIDLDPGTYRWFVQAFFEGCEPVASAIAFFRIAETTPRCPTEAATILEPASNAVVSSPVTISWTGVGEATKYRVFVSRDGENAILLGATTETSIERALPPGQYLVAIESVLDECPSTFSARRTFSVAESQNCTDEAAALIAPANQSTVSTEAVEFVWQPLSGAVKYVVFAQLGEGSPTAIGATDDTHLSRLVPAGAIEWWVLTFFSGCDPTESAHFTFEMSRPADCNNGKPILLLPADETRPIFSPITFVWTAVSNATGYNVWLAQGENDFSIVLSTTAPEAEVDLQQGFYKWYVQATFANCRPRESAVGEFSVRAPIACARPEKPDAQVVGQAQSNTRYKVRWTPLANVGLYELQEATNLEFNDAETFTVSTTFQPFSHVVAGAPVQYLYRVRGVSDCITQSQSSDQRGPYSDVVGVFIIPLKTNNASAEIGAQDKVVQTIFLAGSPTPVKYSATADKPWITITPASGNLPPEGITLTISANPAAIQLGTNTGTIYVAYEAAASGRIQTNGTTLALPVSVSLVTPVTPTGSSSPPPDSLIFPIVGHATGANESLFESDIRVTNLTAQTMKYQVKFTPSGTDGTQTGSSTTVQIEPNQTLAIDDIVSSLFGVGTIGSATGMLEVRPLTTSTSSTGGIFTSVVPGAIKPLTTAAASRTYNFTPTGTFGQFIPAIRFDEFVGKAATGLPASVLSLQQVAQSAAYRANFGFAEGSGQPADLAVRVYDTAGILLKTIPVSLQAGEHKQINGMLSANGITELANGRVEVEVTGGNGKVTAYVSEIDNLTNDPLLVSSVLKGSTVANRYVVPGVAYINTGFAFWVTDLRIYNAGAATPATLTFYPQGNPTAAVTREIMLDAGEIEVINNVIGDLFAQPNGMGGSIVVTTPANAPLTATARTYNQTSSGTYGQYIPGVTPAQSVGVNDRAVQLLQLEQSSRFRTNVGLDETSGQPVRVEVTLIVPDSIVSPVVAFDLQANEFRQFSLADFGLGSAVYNARVTVKATSGTGRVTAYGSAIDLSTQDPTYVPAQ